MTAKQQILLSLEPHTKKTFQYFFSAENSVIIKHLQSLINPDDKTKIQIKQTYLWGATSTGKSHLLQATCQHASQMGMHSAYLPFSEVMTHGPQLLSGFENMDMLCLDDMDAVLPDPEWQKALFHLINAVHSYNSCLIMAGRSNPLHLDISFKDLRSRLVWGLVHGLNPLSDQHKHAALCTFIRNEHSTVTEDAVNYLLNNYSRDLNYLTRLIEQLDNQAKQEKRNRVTIPFIKENVG